jgi:hypothetical protein
LFDNDKGEADLHIVELKGKVGLGTWAAVVNQFEGMFLTALAVARLLQVHELARVTCYLAATEDRMPNSFESASLALLKTPVGKRKTFGGYEFWYKEIVDLPLSIRAPLALGFQSQRTPAAGSFVGWSTRTLEK